MAGNVVNNILGKKNKHKKYNDYTEGDNTIYEEDDAPRGGWSRHPKKDDMY